MSSLVGIIIHLLLCNIISFHKKDSLQLFRVIKLINHLFFTFSSMLHFRCFRQLPQLYVFITFVFISNPVPLNTIPCSCCLKLSAMSIIMKTTYTKSLISISAHADGGPRSRVRAPRTLCSAPHRREREFSGTLVCRITFNIFPNPSEVLSEVSELHDKSF